MIGYVVQEFRGYESDPKTGVQRRREWWWFFTQPFVYSVFWRPDGSKTMTQFATEQAALAKAHLLQQSEQSNG